MHSFPQRNFQIPLARKKRWAYAHAQIEPGSLKNFAAQLKEAQRPQGHCAFNLFSLSFHPVSFPF